MFWSPFTERVLVREHGEAVCADLPLDEKAFWMRRWGHVLEAGITTQRWQEHVDYSLAETARVGRDRVVQRRLLNLGELNTTQIDRWQRFW